MANTLSSQSARWDVPANLKGGLKLNLNSWNVNHDGTWPAINTAVQNWKNLAIAGTYDFTQATVAARPAFGVDSNNYPALGFSGTAWMESDVIPTAATDKFTAIMVYQSAQNGVGTVYTNGLYAVNGFTYNLSDGSGSRSTNFYNSAVKSDGTAGVEKEIAIITWDSVLSRLILNGYDESITNSTSALVSTNGSSQGIVGSTNSPDPEDNTFEGNIYTILYWNRVLTSTELFEMNQLLGGRYGIAVNSTPV